jgi:LysM repeat protein
MHKPILTLSASLLAAAIMSGTALASDGDTAKPAADGKPAPRVHVVQPGDSLSTIAESEKLDSWRALWNANNDLADPNLIYADQKLVVPDGPTQDRPLPEGVVSQAAAAPAAAPVQQAVQQPVVHRAAAANYAGGTGGLFASIRARESGGNYAINTGNGFYGAYQFDLQTWRGLGGSGLPSDASPAEQDMRAQMLYNQRGCSPWPNTCY